MHGRIPRHEALAALWPRLAGRLGFDRNPLRRRTDRAESAVRLVAAAAMLVAVPAAGVAAGQFAEHRAVSQARTQDAAAHAVRAVVLAPGPAASTPDPSLAMGVAWIPARWTAPDGQARPGDVLAPAGARAGTAVRAWVDESGLPAAAPPGRNQVIGDVFLAVMLAMLAAAFAFLAITSLIRRGLYRQRMNAWDAEWRAVAPRWTGYRT